jgi:hypothetical protein
MFENLGAFINENAGIFGLLTFFLGTVFGHWLAVFRDKRKEFNDAAPPVRTWLLNDIQKPSPDRNPPTKIELDTFVSNLGIVDRIKFLKAYEKQNLDRENTKFRDGFGQVLYKDSSKIIQSLESCLKYTKRK